MSKKEKAEDREGGDHGHHQGRKENFAYQTNSSWGIGEVYTMVAIKRTADHGSGLKRAKIKRLWRPSSDCLVKPDPLVMASYEDGVEESQCNPGEHANRKKNGGAWGEDKKRKRCLGRGQKAGFALVQHMPVGKSPRKCPRKK